jgi:hypothetical protein
MTEILDRPDGKVEILPADVTGLKKGLPGVVPAALVFKSRSATIG